METKSVARFLRRAWPVGLVVAACGGESNPGAPAVDAGTDIPTFYVNDGGPDSGKPKPPTASGPAVVYAHTGAVLYKVDTTTNALTKVANFDGCKSSVVDLALDKDSNAIVSDGYGIWRLDLSTAKCTLLSWAVGDNYYPNSLSFVPAGTLDQTSEVLVGYNGSTYERIDTTTGLITPIGSLGDPDLVSSGDVVSVAGGGTFLTVRDTYYKRCNDCLVQIDPKTGSIVKNYGQIGKGEVFGLAFWGGNIYGFNDRVFTISYKSAAIQVTDIIGKHPDIVWFNGAGSTTAAPPEDADGDTFPVVK